MAEWSGEKEYASKGVAGTALGLGAGALGLMALGGNTLGNLGVGADTRCDEVSHLHAKIAKLEAERYADSVGISAYKDMVAFSNKSDDKIAQVVKELADEAVINARNDATMSARIDCLEERVARNFLENRNYTTELVALEAERRECCCNNMRTYVDGHFVPGTLKIMKSDICKGSEAE